MLGPVVGERALHERERHHLAPEALLEPELRERDLARGLRRLELGQRPVPDPVRLDADAARLELRELVPVDGLVPDPEQPQRLLVRQRPRVVEEPDRDEEHRRIPVLAQDRQRVLEVVAVAVVEGQEDGARRERLAVEVVREHGVERDGRVAELAEQRHLLREDRRRDRGRVRPEVVDLVVHEDAERAVGLAVERADAADGLADRAVDAVLQELLRPVGPHGPESRAASGRGDDVRDVRERDVADPGGDPPAALVREVRPASSSRTRRPHRRRRGSLARTPFRRRRRAARRVPRARREKSCAVPPELLEEALGSNLGADHSVGASLVARRPLPYCSARRVTGQIRGRGSRRAGPSAAGSATPAARLHAEASPRLYRAHRRAPAATAYERRCRAADAESEQAARVAGPGSIRPTKWRRGSKRERTSPATSFGTR